MDVMYSVIMTDVNPKSLSHDSNTLSSKQIKSFARFVAVSSVSIFTQTKAFLV